MNILFVYGGKSCEHDISVITACLAKNYFEGNICCAYFDSCNKCFLVSNKLSPKEHKNLKHKDRLVFLTGERAVAVIGKRRIKKVIGIDCAVILNHGVNGEDGAAAGLLQLSGIPYVESGTEASGVAMDKILTKYVLRGMRIPVVKGVPVTQKQFDEGDFSALKRLKFPIICKPSLLGSSIGIKVAHDMTELKEALKIAFNFDKRVLCEEALTDFFEINCAAFSSEGKVVLSSADVPVTASEILSFADKYLAGGKGFAPLTDKNEKAKPYELLAAKLTAVIYEKMGFSGVIRVDFLVDREKGKLYVNEINAVPGSLAYGLFKDKFTEKEFGKALLSAALDEFRETENLNFLFESRVLDGFGNIKK